MASDRSGLHHTQVCGGAASALAGVCDRLSGRSQPRARDTFCAATEDHPSGGGAEV